MDAPFVRNPFNYDLAEASDESAHVPVGQSLTVQSQSEDTDVNVLMKRFGVVSAIPESSFRMVEYGDFTEVHDFRSAFEASRNAAAEFMKIPAETRARFNNDPQIFLEYCSDPNNLNALRSMGLAKPLPSPPPPETPAPKP